VICERAADVIAIRCAAGSLIALYAHKGSEVETAALDERLRASGFRIAYPRVVDESRVLAFFEVAIDALGKSRWGLREPNADADRVAIETIAAFVVPGLAFDRAGGRIGWGKGHYDATLTAARADAECIGLAFECQVVENVPRESHDVALDAIITEVATHVVAAEK
jgi:5-formyltetrahydrofolate cyclo-ligase